MKLMVQFLDTTDNQTKNGYLEDVDGNNGIVVTKGKILSIRLDRLTPIGYHEHCSLDFGNILHG